MRSIELFWRLLHISVLRCIKINAFVNNTATQIILIEHSIFIYLGAQWLSGGVLDSRPKGRGFEPHQRHCVVSFSKNINPSLVLVQPKKTCPFITERLLMGRKESNQTNKQIKQEHSIYIGFQETIHLLSWV